MRDAGIRLGARAVFLIAAAWMAAAACGGTVDDAGPSTTDYCHKVAALPCAPGTETDCNSQTSQARDIAANAGCSSQWDQALSCGLAHPPHCEGASPAVDPACTPLSESLSQCITSTPGGNTALCSLTKDPCAGCICMKCPCDAQCVAGAQPYGDCENACFQGPSSNVASCIQQCDAAAPPSWRSYLACAGSAVCRTECNSFGVLVDGGVSDAAVFTP